MPQLDTIFVANLAKNIQTFVNSSTEDREKFWDILPDYIIGRLFNDIQCEKLIREDRKWNKAQMRIKLENQI